MSNSKSAQILTKAFYSLGELEFLQPRQEFPEQKEIVRRLIREAQELTPSDFHFFAKELIQKIAACCLDKDSNQDVLYRAFDDLDDLLTIDYQENHEGKLQNQTTERLYEGGGIGVQTSYASILKVLEHLRPPAKSHLVDLGSGFGRVGLTTGLWRDDLQFTGYEFVEHRVTASNASAERAGVGERVRFIQKDLSLPSFEIPAADIYYLYDPFSDATYRHVFARLSEVSRLRTITVVAKDDASENFLRWTNPDDWSPRETLDEGTLSLFRSRGLELKNAITPP